MLPTTSNAEYLFPMTFYECHHCRRSLAEPAFARLGHGRPDGLNYECRACWAKRNTLLRVRLTSRGFVPRGRFYGAVTLLWDA